MVRSRRVLPAVTAAAVLAALATTGAASAAPAVSTPSSALLSVVPAWAKTASVVGATPDDQTVYVMLALKGKDPVGEQAYVTAVSTPGNALYRHWLTKEQVEERFGAQPGAATAVVAALRTLGVSSTKVNAFDNAVMLSMPASLASSVFQVSFQQVLHGGQSTRVALGQPTLPAVLAPYVSVVSGLSQELVHTDTEAIPAQGPALAPAPALPTLPGGINAPATAYFNAKPTSTYYGSAPATTLPTAPVLAGETSAVKPYVTSGYTPKQIRGAYGVDQTTYTGKGVTAGVVLFYDGPTVADDLATFSTAFGLAAPDYTDLSPENMPTDIVAGNAPILMPIEAAGEQTLDVESIHQMAPDAAIVYSGALAPEDPPIYIAEDTAIVGGAEVINNSFGGVGDTDAADAQVFASTVTDIAAMMGVGLNFSTGDSGDEVTAQGVRELDFPASSDGVTGVGGTGIEIGKDNDYEGEFYWGTYTSPAYTAGDTAWKQAQSQAGGAGGGGGLSTNYAEPDWQKGVVPDSETTDKDTAAGVDETTGVAADEPGRVLPDVAMIADSTTGILVGETQMPDVGPDGTAATAEPTYSYYRIGGTSVSSPIFTGMMALVDEALGTSAGFVNPTMYPFLAKHDGAFRDPQIGRTATGSRLGGTAAQSLTGCTTADATVCAGTGPGVVPVVSEVRADFTDTANDGISTGNTTVFHLRAQGVLGTLEDLPGYDDSTGLGSPYAPRFIADFLPASTPTAPVVTPTGSATPAPSASATAAPVAGEPSVEAAPVSTLAHTGLGLGLPVLAVGSLVGATVVVRRRRRA